MLSFSGRKLHRDFWALREINLTVEKGETLGVIGPNGSGKSTLLQIVCGIVRPTSGRVSTEGRIAALLELGAGFNPEFTGRENVFLNGEIMGLSRGEVEGIFPQIASFAEIGDFMERPVKEYSSGMYIRLAFATAIHVAPDILIVDEALAVGDAIFSNRCIQKFEELKRKHVTVLFVSHDLGLVKQLSDRTVLLVNGRVAALGQPAAVVNRYVGMVLEREKSEPNEAVSAGRVLNSSFRHGDGTSRILDAVMLNSTGEAANAFQSGEVATVKVRARFFREAENPVVGILIRNRLGIDVYGTNTREEGLHLGAYKAGERLEVEFSFPCLLTRQEYTLTVATQHWDGTSQDWLDDVFAFAVIDTREAAGVVRLQPRITWNKN